jgi:hypothetical protein
MRKKPDYPIEAADLDDVPKVRRAAQELASPPRERRYDFYEAHPEYRPRRLSSRRARRQWIREG